MTPSEQTSIAGAGDRFFRAYMAHCVRPDSDTLFALLNAIHSLNDRVRKADSGDFFSFKEFAGLKALRNLFHHEDELRSEVRALAVEDLPPITSELLFMCLVPRTLVEKALAGMDGKRRERDEPLAREAFKWYRNVVDINPCIFNMAVHIFELLDELDVSLSSDAYFEFRRSYEWEEREGHNHFVRGELTCRLGDVDEVLNRAFADIR